MMKRILILCFVLVVLKMDSFGQSITTAFTAFSKKEQLETAHLGLWVYNLDADTLVYAHNQDKYFVPASLQKIITTDVAIALLGEDYTFETRFEIEGNIDTTSGTLNGNVIVIGGGDPTLASDRVNNNLTTEDLLTTFSQGIQDLGITTIAGKIIVDETIFDSHPPQSWTWEDIANYYGAAAQGLTFQENKYYLTFQQAATDEATKIIKVEPKQDLDFSNEVVGGKAGSGDNAFILGSPFSKERIVVGTIAPGTGTFTIKGAMPNTAPTFERLLATRLRQDGLTIQNQYFEYDNCKNCYNVFTHESPDLKEIVRMTNHNSVNLYAEHLLKTLGYEMLDDGTTDGGIKAVEAYIGGRIMPENGIEIKDGSGLSRKDLMTPKFMGMWLQKSYGRDALYESLPIAGESGTMKYFSSATIKGKVRAKSGTAGSIINYAGYITNDKGEELAFSFFVNNYNGSRQQVRREMVKVIESLL